MIISTILAATIAIYPGSNGQVPEPQVVEFWSASDFYDEYCGFRDALYEFDIANGIPQDRDDPHAEFIERHNFSLLMHDWGVVLTEPVVPATVFACP